MNVSRLIHLHAVRFALVFIGAFLVFSALLSSRYVAANVHYMLGENKQTNDQPRILPLSKNVSSVDLPGNATLVINGIGIYAPVIFGVPTKNALIYQNLEQGVVHYLETPKPGERGTAIILGHSSAYPWYRGAYGSVFALLNKLSPGDNIAVRYSDGRTFEFNVTQSLVFNPLEDDSRLVELEQSARPSIILVSCWPVGTSYRRIAVKAELI